MCCGTDMHGKDVSLERHNTIKDEIICHLPIAIFAVAMTMVVLSFLSYITPADVNAHGAHQLFHNFHYLHLLFAATGTVLTFRKYSKNIFIGILVGFLVPAVFCTLSDAILPYFSGELLGVDMSFHWCFIKKLGRVLPFLFAGMLNGWFMSEHDSNRQLFYSQGFHFLHIFISAMASILYLVSFGFADWHKSIGLVFIQLILVVLIPCTLSDIVVPMIFAKKQKRKVNKK